MQIVELLACQADFRTHFRGLHSALAEKLHQIASAGIRLSGHGIPGSSNESISNPFTVFAWHVLLPSSWYRSSVALSRRCRRRPLIRLDSNRSACSVPASRPNPVAPRFTSTASK
jgi:hypothetical protein